MQLLFNLHATSTVTDVAHDAARTVAGHEVDPTDPAAVGRAELDAEGRARDLLGSVGDRAEFDWSASTPDDVVLHIRVETPRVLLPRLQATLGFDVVDRTVRVRREVPR